MSTFHPQYDYTLNGINFILKSFLTYYRDIRRVRVSEHDIIEKFILSISYTTQCPSFESLKKKKHKIVKRETKISF